MTQLLLQFSVLSYILGGTVVAAYGAKNLVRGALGYLGPSADVLAQGQLEVKLADIPEGKSATFKWRDKPLFIRHRTAEEIEAEQVRLFDKAGLLLCFHFPNQPLCGKIYTDGSTDSAGCRWLNNTVNQLNFASVKFCILAIFE